MKTRSQLLFAAVAAVAASALAQESRPFPPPPPIQPLPPIGRGVGAPPEMQNQPFLGVVTRPAPAELRAQLNLPEGFGLVVDEVLPNSPAANGGIQKYDILKLLNDQQLASPEQLAALVRAAGNGKQVMLTLIRVGQEQKVTVTVGEHSVPRNPPMLGRDVFFRRFPEPWGNDVKEQAERARKQAEEQMERAQKEFKQRMEEFRTRPGKDPKSVDLRPETILFESRPGADGKIQVLTNSSVTTVDGAKAHVLIRDQDGELEVANENGKRLLTAKSPEGKIAFNGPIDTDEQRKEVPEVYRKKLDILKGIQVRSAAGIGDAPAPVELEDALTDSPNVQ